MFQKTPRKGEAKQNHQYLIETVSIDLEARMDTEA